MEQSVTRVSGKGKIARVLLAALLSLVGLTVVGVGSAYAASLSVKSVTPATGPTAGGTTVTVTGSGFSGVTGVTFGGVPAESFTPGTALKLTAVAPAAASSTAVVDVQVVTSGGTSPIVPADEYTYTWSAAPVVTGVSPSAGPIAGGTSVTITGSNLAGASAVTFGTTAATSFHINSDNSITATAPASASPAQSDITVTTPFSGSSTSATSRADLYNWVTTPTLTGVTTVANPAGGPAGGGTQVQILGTGFSSVSAVDFGATPATSFLTNSLGSISAIAPAGTGTVDVTVTTPLGTTATSSADQYTYNSTFTVVPGTASYSSGVSTSTGSTANPTIVDSFNPLTLVTGGGTIDPTKTVIVTQPASGTVAVSGNQIKYTPVWHRAMVAVWVPVVVVS